MVVRRIFFWHVRATYVRLVSFDLTFLMVVEIYQTVFEVNLNLRRAIFGFKTKFSENFPCLRLDMVLAVFLAYIDHVIRPTRVN